MTGFQRFRLCRRDEDTWRRPKREIATGQFNLVHLNESSRRVSAGWASQTEGAPRIQSIKSISGRAMTEANAFCFEFCFVWANHFQFNILQFYFSWRIKNQGRESSEVGESQINRCALCQWQLLSKVLLGWHFERNRHCYVESKAQIARDWWVFYMNQGH